MSDGNIFYSQIDLNLQAELNARGRAGMQRRTNSSLNYMLEKIANAEIVAMVDQKHVDPKDPENEKNILHRLGGKDVREGAYLPTGVNGFLTKRQTLITDPQNPIGTTSIDSSYRIPPFLTSADIQLNDHSMGLLNSATANIVIPNPDRDLDFMESVYARPGRAITLLIEHPDSAVVTKQLLKNSTIQPQIKAQADAQKMNRIKFNGLIKSFSYSYQPDGTVVMTVYLIGTSNVYTDVSMYAYKPDTKTPTDNSTTSPLQASSFYKEVYNEIDTLFKSKTDDKIKIKSAYIQSADVYTDVISSYGYESDDHWWSVMHDWNQKEQRYITLAYLINFLNRYIISKQQSVAPAAYIICNNKFCQSNYLPSLVSANPMDVWITGDEHDYYGNVTAERESKLSGTNLTSKNWFEDKDPKAGVLPPFGTSNEDAPGKIGNPSHILINLNVIDRILVELLKTPEDFKATNFLMEISKLIAAATGNFINMKLISYPEDPDYLIYYDSNYKGVGTHNVTPYSVPMFANHPYGTIVREFKFESKLPQNMQALMYTVNQSETISEEKIAPFLNYMYNNRVIVRSLNKVTGLSTEKISNDVDPAVKEKLDAKYKETHEKYLTALNTAKLKFAADGLTNKATQTELSNALIKHIQWPTSTIKDASQMTAAVYPMEASFTIDGINGLRYGDTVEFAALPAKYKNNSTFSIIGIAHTINTSGEWTTAVNCIMRPKFD
jgi:hypothetical protein